MKLSYLLTGAAITLSLAGAANATTFFGPATGAIAILGSPAVTLGAASGTAAFSSPVAIFATTGDLTAASGSGNANGTLNFSSIPGVVTSQSLSSFMTFADNSGGNFIFDVQSAQTLSYSQNPSSASIVLYLLGTAGDAKLGLAQAPTSETLTINRTGASAYSSSATIAAPPSGAVPEPASWALMLIGFGAAGAVVRRQRRAALVQA